MLPPIANDLHPELRLQNALHPDALRSALNMDIDDGIAFLWPGAPQMSERSLR